MKRFFASLTRLSDLEKRPFDVAPLPRDAWGNGDYVICEVVGTPSAIYRVELTSGRRTPVLPGQQVVGAFGMRAATHECSGDWRAIGDDLQLHQLTGAGLFGKATSVSRWTPRPMELEYLGHVTRGGAKIGLADFVAPAGERPFAIPSVIVVGTSMSTGKTLTCRTLVALLKQKGMSVAAAKLTGAAGYKDALGYGDAGADYIFDYVDAGLTDTLCSAEAFETAMAGLLGRVADTGADVFVGEIGASPLEPYNGLTALKMLDERIRLAALVASDAYAAKGFLDSVPLAPDFVAGPVANTSASANLVRTLTGLDVIDLGSGEGEAALNRLIEQKLA